VQGPLRPRLGLRLLPSSYYLSVRGLKGTYCIEEVLEENGLGINKRELAGAE